MNRKVLLTTLVIFSIGLNLVFVGVLVGRHIFGIPPVRPHFDWMMNDVSEETRSKIRTSMVEHMRASRPARRDLRGAQNQLHAAISADNYVEADVVAGLSEVRRASALLQKTMHEQLVRNLEHLEPEERIHALRMMMRKDRGRHGPPPGGPEKPGRPPVD